MLAAGLLHLQAVQPHLIVQIQPAIQAAAALRLLTAKTQTRQAQMLPLLLQP